MVRFRNKQGEEMNINEVVYQEAQFLQKLVPFDRVWDLSASLCRIEAVVNERITELEEALATLMDEYQCQNGFDTHYDAAEAVLHSQKKEEK